MPLDTGHDRRSFGKSLYVAALLLLSWLVSPTAAQSAPQSQTPRFALLVGVDDYALAPDRTATVAPLKGPRNDVALMKKLLLDHYQFRDDGTQIVTLVGKDATHAAIRNAFTALVNRAAAAPGAVVLFYFSGHGSQYEDLNGDEGDGLDETLVAFDSRTANGSDILDDELAAWQAELMRRAPTAKMTYIFDSCHSGTGIKLVTASADRVARFIPPRRAPSSAVARGPEPVNTLLAEGRDYALLAGSEAANLSYEDAIDTKAGRIIYGLFTYNLDLALRQDPLVSYDAVVRRVITAFRRDSSDQLPQAEGATERLVLDGTGEREDPYVPVLAVQADGQFKIGAGAMLGVRKGAILAVYAPGTKKLVGDAGKIGDAQIFTLGDGESIARFTAPPKRALTTDARVAIVTPFFGLDPMRVNLAELPGQPIDAEDRTLLADVAARLRAGRFVTIAAPGEAWAVAVAKGCRKGERLYLLGEAQPSGCASAYYLRGRDSNAALMGFQTPANAGAAAALAEKVEDRARQENVRAIENQLSPIDGQVTLRLLKVDIVTGPDGRPVARPLPPEPRRGVMPIKVGDRFMLRVDNDSDLALYVAVFDLASGGKNYLVGSTTNGDLIGPHRSMIVTSRPWVVGAPLGLESFKVIATTRGDVNFRVLDNKRATAKGPQEGPLEWLLSTTVDAKARDSGPGSVALDSWTTTRLDLNILP